MIQILLITVYNVKVKIAREEAIVSDIGEEKRGDQLYVEKINMAHVTIRLGRHTEGGESIHRHTLILHFT